MYNQLIGNDAKGRRPRFNLLIDQNLGGMNSRLKYKEIIEESFDQDGKPTSISALLNALPLHPKNYFRKSGRLYRCHSF